MLIFFDCTQRTDLFDFERIELKKTVYAYFSYCFKSSSFIEWLFWFARDVFKAFQLSILFSTWGKVFIKKSAGLYETGQWKFNLETTMETDKSPIEVHNLFGSTNLAKNSNASSVLPWKTQRPSFIRIISEKHWNISDVGWCMEQIIAFGGIFDFEIISISCELSDSSLLILSDIDARSLLVLDKYFIDSITLRALKLSNPVVGSSPVSIEIHMKIFAWFEKKKNTIQKSHIQKMIGGFVSNWNLIDSCFKYYILRNMTFFSYWKLTSVAIFNFFRSPPDNVDIRLLATCWRPNSRNNKSTRWFLCDREQRRSNFNSAMNCKCSLGVNVASVTSNCGTKHDILVIVFRSIFVPFSKSCPSNGPR